MKSLGEREIFNPWTAQDSPRRHEGEMLVQLQIINSTSSCVLLQLYLFGSLEFIVIEFFLFKKIKLLCNCFDQLRSEIPVLLTRQVVRECLIKFS